MAITTRVRTRFVVWTLGFAIVCLVLGLWGAYDYFYAIPERQMLVERKAILEVAIEALEKERKQNGKLSTNALEQLEAEKDKFPATADEIDEDDQPYYTAFNKAGVALTTKPENMTDAEYAKKRDAALTALREHFDAYRDVETPSTFDRAMQIAYILCLPCVPVLFFMYIKTKRQKYVIDDEGNLSLPEGDWAAKDIADIDMSIWMKKSVASVVHQDGTRVLLDDYKHVDLHLIIGALAHRFYPDEWREDARKVGAEDEDEAGEDENPAQDKADDDGDEAEAEEVERH